MTLALTGSYVGKMLPFYDETILNPDSTRGARIGDEVNGYLLLGSNLRIENIFYNGFYLDVKCNNILNNEIRYPTTNNNSWADRGTLGPGRTFLVGIGKKF
jgi:hypothetical protein